MKIQKLERTRKGPSRPDVNPQQLSPRAVLLYGREHAHTAEQASSYLKILSIECTSPKNYAPQITHVGLNNLELARARSRSYVFADEGKQS